MRIYIEDNIKKRIAIEEHKNFTCADSILALVLTIIKVGEYKSQLNLGNYLYNGIFVLQVYLLYGLVLYCLGKMYNTWILNRYIKIEKDGVYIGNILRWKKLGTAEYIQLSGSFNDDELFLSLNGEIFSLKKSKLKNIKIRQ